MAQRGAHKETGVGEKMVLTTSHSLTNHCTECRECKFCKSGKTNLCGRVRTTQGKGVMPDGTTRFKCKGQDILHFVNFPSFFLPL